MLIFLRARGHLLSAADQNSSTGNVEHLSAIWLALAFDYFHQFSITLFSSCNVITIANLHDVILILKARRIFSGNERSWPIKFHLNSISPSWLLCIMWFNDQNHCAISSQRLRGIYLFTHWDRVEMISSDTMTIFFAFFIHTTYIYCCDIFAFFIILV